MVRGEVVTTRRARRCTAVLLAGLLGAGAHLAAPGRTADASLVGGIPAAGECIVSGTVGFPSGISTGKPISVSLTATGGCAGAFVPSGNTVQINVGTQLAGVATCAALEAVLVGTVTFGPQPQAGFTGEAELTGNMASLQVTPLPIANSAGDTFAGVALLAVTSLDAWTVCLRGAAFTINVSGVFLFASA